MSAWGAVRACLCGGDAVCPAGGLGLCVSGLLFSGALLLACVFAVALGFTPSTQTTAASIVSREHVRVASTSARCLERAVWKALR